MKISDRFNLGATQFELDFVDIDTAEDKPLYLDPLHLSVQTDAWCTSASRTLVGFFQTFIDFVNAGELDTARMLFSNFNEPNETCLGESAGKPQGLGVGEIDGNTLFQSILDSDAVKNGIASSMADFKFFVPGISNDKISDMTTNIIRGHLISYTQNQCRLWGIPLTSGVQSGFFWDQTLRRWSNKYEDMLVIDDQPILLVPKHAVSYVKSHIIRKLHAQFILTYLQKGHLDRGSSLVQKRKNGSGFVTKKSVRETEAPERKEFIALFVKSNPVVFKNFIDWAKTQAKPLEDRELVTDGSEVDETVIAAYLIDKLKGIKPGRDEADFYHKSICGILEFLFYPKLVSPIIENEVNQGRKRIDITFDNNASSGFFQRIHAIDKIPAQYIFIECKNYSREIANPELDQLIGRLSPNRGKVGFLMCRATDDMDTLLLRCNDAYIHDQGLLIPIVDEDVLELLTSVAEGKGNGVDNFLSDRKRKIILN